MGHHHRHPIFQAIAHIDALPRHTLHIPPRCTRRATLGRKARMYPHLFLSFAVMPTSYVYYRLSIKT